MFIDDVRSEETKLDTEPQDEKPPPTNYFLRVLDRMAHIWQKNADGGQQIADYHIVGCGRNNFGRAIGIRLGGCLSIG